VDPFHLPGAACPADRVRHQVMPLESGSAHPKSWGIVASVYGAAWILIDRRDNSVGLNGRHVTNLFHIAPAPGCRMTRLALSVRKAAADLFIGEVKRIVKESPDAPVRFLLDVLCETGDADIGAFLAEALDRGMPDCLAWSEGRTRLPFSERTLRLAAEKVLDTMTADLWQDARQRVRLIEAIGVMGRPIYHHFPRQVVAIALTDLSTKVRLAAIRLTVPAFSEDICGNDFPSR